MATAIVPHGGDDDDQGLVPHHLSQQQQQYQLRQEEEIEELERNRSKLCVLYHAATCPFEGVPGRGGGDGLGGHSQETTGRTLAGCPHTSHCCAAKRLFGHMITCTQSGMCEVPGCPHARLVWKHYRKCQKAHPQDCELYQAVPQPYNPKALCKRFRTSSSSSSSSSYSNRSAANKKNGSLVVATRSFGGGPTTTNAAKPRIGRTMSAEGTTRTTTQQQQLQQQLDAHVNNNRTNQAIRTVPSSMSETTQAASHATGTTWKFTNGRRSSFEKREDQNTNQNQQHGSFSFAENETIVGMWPLEEDPHDQMMMRMTPLQSRSFSSAPSGAVVTPEGSSHDHPPPHHHAVLPPSSSSSSPSTTHLLPPPSAVWGCGAAPEYLFRTTNDYYASTVKAAATTTLDSRRITTSSDHMAGVASNDQNNRYNRAINTRHATTLREQAKQHEQQRQRSQRLLQSSANIAARDMAMMQQQQQHHRPQRPSPPSFYNGGNGNGGVDNAGTDGGGGGGEIPSPTTRSVQKSRSFLSKVKSRNGMNRDEARRIVRHQNAYTTVDDAPTDMPSPQRREKRPSRVLPGLKRFSS